MKIYIASSLANAKEAKSIANKLLPDDVVATYAWWEHGSVASEGLSRYKEVAEAEFGGVAAAECVLALFPGGYGTHVEIGAALGMGKRVFIFAHLEEKRDGGGFIVVKNQLVGPSGYESVFYRHPLVTLIDRDRGFDAIRAELFAVHIQATGGL